MGRPKQIVPTQLRESLLIPSCIFSDRTISFSESLVEYLYTEARLTPSQIGQLISMDRRNVWTMIRRAASKRRGKLPSYDYSNNIFIPINIFKSRKETSLGTIISYLKSQRLTNKKIGQALSRSDKTIWTVFDRVRREGRT